MSTSRTGDCVVFNARNAGPNLAFVCADLGAEIGLHVQRGALRHGGHQQADVGFRRPFATNVRMSAVRPSGSDTPQPRSLKPNSTAAEGTPLYAYIVLSVLTGARTEELRALTWDHVDLEGRPDDNPPVPPSIMVWRSGREGGDTKTKKSRRTLALPLRAVVATRRHRELQDQDKERAGNGWQDRGLVFATSKGTELDAANVRRAFRRVIKKAGLNPKDWTPRELRHSFVSLLSDQGVRIEDIAELVGHAGTRVTEQVYRHQLRPVLLGGAAAMDRIFGLPDHDQET
jgi:integrase